MRFHRVTLKYRAVDWHTRFSSDIRCAVEEFFQRNSTYDRDAGRIVLTLDCVSPERVTAYSLGVDHALYGVTLESVDVKWIT